MHMYYRLRANLVRERQATDELCKYANLNARIHRVDGGYVLLVPAGRRPTAVLKYLDRFDPLAEWDIVGWDADDGVVELPSLPEQKKRDDGEYGYLGDE